MFANVSERAHPSPWYAIYGGHLCLGKSIIVIIFRIFQLEWSEWWQQQHAVTAASLTTLKTVAQSGEKYLSVDSINGYFSFRPAFSVRIHIHIGQSSVLSMIFHFTRVTEWRRTSMCLIYSHRLPAFRFFLSLLFSVSSKRFVISSCQMPVPV